MATTKSIPGSGFGNPFIDGLIRGGVVWDENSGPVKVYLAGSGDTLGDHNLDAGFSVDGQYVDWSGAEVASVDYALALFSSVSRLQLQRVGSKAEADIVLAKNTSITYTQDGIAYDIASHHEFPRQSGQTWGFFNPNSEGWAHQGHGGDGRHTILHELAHALGLHHVRDDDEFPQDYSLFTYNQGIYTVMASGVLGAEPETGQEGVARPLDQKKVYGAQGGLGAFDIAALQAIYGANNGARLGNDVYTLPVTQGPGTGWYTIWDSGGIDTIDASASTLRVGINLNGATLVPNIPEKGGKDAGGPASSKIDVSGGFTIAAGTVIENARGGSSGDDLIGNGAANTLWGGDGPDKLYGEAGNDVLFGENGDDSLYGGLGDDALHCGTTRNGGSEGFDFAHGHQGNDTITGAEGDHSLHGEEGDDTITDMAGFNILAGYSGNDVLRAGSGRDTLNGGADQDRLHGGGDNDKMYGEDGNDILFGEGDADLVYGGHGNDVVYGGSGLDLVAGDEGNDILYGGAHRDNYRGGAGRDKFVLDSRPNRKQKPEIFEDFKPKDDQIVLKKPYFKISKKLIKKNKLKKDAFTFGSKAKDDEDRIIVNKAKKVIYFDKDGEGGAAAIMIAELKSVKGLSYRDFELG